MSCHLCLGFSNGLFPRDFTVGNLHLWSAHACYMCFVHPILDFIIVIIYKASPPVIFSVWYVSFFASFDFLKNCPSLFSFCNFRIPIAYTMSRGNWECSRTLSVNGHYSSAISYWTTASKATRMLLLNTQKPWKRQACNIGIYFSVF
jgi:hypothetical protein